MLSSTDSLSLTDQYRRACGLTSELWYGNPFRMTSFSAWMSGPRSDAVRIALRVTSSNGAELPLSSVSVTMRVARLPTCRVTSSPAEPGGSTGYLDRAPGMFCCAPLRQMAARLYGVSSPRRRCRRGFAMSCRCFLFRIGTRGRWSV